MIKDIDSTNEFGMDSGLNPNEMFRAMLLKQGFDFETVSEIVKTSQELFMSVLQFEEAVVEKCTRKLLPHNICEGVASGDMTCIQKANQFFSDSQIYKTTSNPFPKEGDPATLVVIVKIYRKIGEDKAETLEEGTLEISFSKSEEEPTQQQ